jgi:hypothetical protein
MPQAERRGGPQPGRTGNSPPGSRARGRNTAFRSPFSMIRRCAGLPRLRRQQGTWFDITDDLP